MLNKIKQNLSSYFSRKRYLSKKILPESPLPEKERQFLKLLPKAEIHFHFEGAISAETIFQLGRKYQIDDIRTLNDAKWFLSFSNAHEFFQRFLHLASLLRHPDDLYEAAIDIGNKLYKENIQYIEITIAPHKFIRGGIPYSELIEAIDCGLNDSEGANTREHRFIIDIVRDLGPEIGMEMVKIVEKYPHPRVVGIGLGGSEAYPPELSKPVFEYATSIGLRKTAHAGEGRGAESVWDTIHSLGVERIDHGVRSFEDPVLLNYLKDNRIPLNMCPMSNMILGIVQTLKTHPFRQYYTSGIPVTIGTDDPTFFQVTLSDEYENVVAYQNIPLFEIPLIIENALKASFLPHEEKSILIDRFRKDTEYLMQEHNKV